MNSGGGLGASGKTIFIVFVGNRMTFPRPLAKNSHFRILYVFECHSFYFQL